MVGVPGKSKGCSTCRRRKKGCDQKRPICGQCAQSGYVCGGYQRELTFIVHPSCKLAEKSYYITPNAQQTSVILLPSSLDRAGIEAQCRALFWDLYLPHGVAEAQYELLQQCNSPPNWTSILLELTHDESALDLAFSALSIARVGRSNNDMRLLKESTKLYGKALKDLQKALYDPSRMHSEEILAACSLLGLYEMFEGGTVPGRSVGWVSHAQGAAHLIELRGPSKHIERQAHQVFLGARLPIIYAAVLRRKGTFLASHEWTTVPWQKYDKTKPDLLADTLAKIPELLERFDAIRMAAAAPDTREYLMDLLSQCEELRAALDVWEDNECSRARPVTVDHERQENDTYPFEHKFSWENHLFMYATIVHWTGQLILVTTENQIELLLSSLGFAQPNMFLSAASLQQQARNYALCIAQSVPYSLLPEMGALGVNYISFPMCIAFRHFLESNEDAICSWMVQTCYNMQKQGPRIPPFDEGIVVETPEDTNSVPSRKGSADLDATSPFSSTTPAATSASGSEALNTEMGMSSPYAGAGKMFRSTFIYENPAKYYVDASEPG